MSSQIIKDNAHAYAEAGNYSEPAAFQRCGAILWGRRERFKICGEDRGRWRARKSKRILKAWAEKEDALTGFYHGILDEIEKRVKVKEYIDDSIVQHNVHIGDKIGTLVKDSVVQRSNIGAGVRKCPNCGREVEANEKFCLECGAKL